MMNVKKYQKQYYMRRFRAWTGQKKTALTKHRYGAVDLRDGNQALVIPDEPGAEGRISNSSSLVSRDRGRLPGI